MSHKGESAKNPGFLEINSVALSKKAKFDHIAGILMDITQDPEIKVLNDDEKEHLEGAAHILLHASKRITLKSQRGG